MDSILYTWLSKKILDNLFSVFKKELKEKHTSVVSNLTDLELSLNNHLKQVEIWTSEISFKELSRPKPMAGSFIELESYLAVRRKFLETQASERQNLLQFISENLNRNIIILGQPGAGKTTSIKKICQNLLHRENYLKDINFPILIRLKELGSTETCLDKLFNILNFQLRTQVERERIFKKEVGGKMVDEKIKEKIEIEINADNAYEYKQYFQSEFYNLLDNFKVLIVLDGLDEIAESRRNQIIQELQIMSLSFLNSRFILTSRTADYNFQIDNSIETEICDLSNSQVVEFVDSWLNDKSKSTDFIKKVGSSPFSDTVIRPLNLAHLLAIYDRENTIPDKPKSVYRKLINVIIEEWDQQRFIIRKSRYSNFDKDIKFEFLSNLSYELTITYNSHSFTKEKLETVYRNISKQYKLPLNEAKQVVNEIESHNGLLIQTSYETYEFSHKSLQEYLCAYYLCGLKKLSKKIHLTNIPNELAICVAISSNSNEYLYDLVTSDLKEYKFSLSFVKPFLNRLLIEKVEFFPDFRIIAGLLLMITKLEIESFGSIKKDSNSKSNFDLIMFSTFFKTHGLFPHVISVISDFYYAESDNCILYSGNKYTILKLKSGTNNIDFPSRLYLPTEWKDYYERKT